MTGEQAQPTLFERGSNVHEYWLAHAEGFHVVSRRKPRRRVDHVVVDPELGSATALVVRRRRGGRPRHIPVMWVTAVDPFERLLYLTPKRPAHAAAERLRPQLVEAARRIEAAVVWLRPRALEAVRVARLACVRAAVWLRPRLVEASRRAAVATAHAYRASHAHSLAAYAWLAPRAATVFRRVGRAVRSAPGRMRAHPHVQAVSQACRNPVVLQRVRSVRLWSDDRR